MKNKSYILLLSIGLVSFSFFVYKSYVYNVNIVNSEKKQVEVINTMCDVQRGQSRNVSEVYIKYNDVKYKLIVESDFCYNVYIGDVIDVFYSTELDVFSESNKENRPRLYVFLGFVLVILFLLIKVLFV